MLKFSTRDNKLAKNKEYWRTNEKIRAQELRVIGSDGKQIGVLPKDKALKEAKKQNLDLVEIAPNAKPPVAKIINFGKFKYSQEKKKKKSQKKAKTSDIKEIRFSPFIAEQDYKTRLSRIFEFLDEGNKVKVSVVFKGRQLGSKDFGYKITDKVLTDIRESQRTIVIDMEPKFLGRHLSMIVSPVKTVKKENAESKNQKISNQKV